MICCCLTLTASNFGVGPERGFYVVAVAVADLHELGVRFTQKSRSKSKGVNTITVGDEESRR